jgi:hypothetical protein
MMGLQARPAVISFALDDPADLVKQAQGVGSPVTRPVRSDFG